MKKVISIFSISVIIFLSSCKTEVNKKCSLCGGSGTITEKVTCDECKGKGQIKCTYSATYGSNTILFGDRREEYHCENGKMTDGYSYLNGVCPRCKGSGYNECWKCDGYGYIKKEKSCYACGGDGQVKKDVWIWETW